jgi:hypothetical protein
MPRAAWRLLALVGLIAGCGDAPTSDPRAYTKAPLEKMGPFMKAEPRSDVAAFARPNLPVAEPVVLSDSARAGGK